MNSERRPLTGISSSVVSFRSTQRARICTRANVPWASVRSPSSHPPHSTVSTLMVRSLTLSDLTLYKSFNASIMFEWLFVGLSVHRLQPHQLLYPVWTTAQNSHGLKLYSQQWPTLGVPQQLGSCTHTRTHINILNHTFAQVNIHTHTCTHKDTHSPTCTHAHPCIQNKCRTC